MKGGESPDFIYGALIIAVGVMVLMPMFLGVFAPAAYSGDRADELLDGYERMTGQAASTKVSVWPLVGIYTPFTGTLYDEEANDGEGQLLTYGYTSDGWLYGSSIKSYTPDQYRSTSQQYTVYRADDGVFRYYANSADYNEEFQLGHKAGDLYTEVSFDRTKMSDIFFVESSRQEDSLGHFKFDFTGYRYSFMPISNYTAVDQDGNSKPIIASTTSLSMIWYAYAGQTGLSGQLTIQGSSGGVAYLNAANILSAFNANTSTASFPMVFNGVEMTIIIKIDPVQLYNGWTVEQCYNGGYWSVMVTSMSVESSAYTGTDNANNPMKMFETMIDLLTFNMDDYNISPWLQYFLSIVFVLPLYCMLISLSIEHPEIWFFVGVLAALQAIGSIWPW